MRYYPGRLASRKSIDGIASASSLSAFSSVRFCLSVSLLDDLCSRTSIPSALYLYLLSSYSIVLSVMSCIVHSAVHQMYGPDESTWKAKPEFKIGQPETGASIPSEAMMHFPLFQISPYFRKIFTLCGK